MKQEKDKLDFPDYDPDVMETSDAKAIISHFKEIYPKLFKIMSDNNILFSYLYRHVDAYMENIETFKEQGFRLQGAREFAFAIIKDDIKTESTILANQTGLTVNTLPSILFDLDINPQLDTDTF